MHTDRFIVLNWLSHQLPTETQDNERMNKPSITFHSIIAVSCEVLSDNTAYLQNISTENILYRDPQFFSFGEPPNQPN